MTAPGGLQPNTLYYGDCLEWLPRFPSESVDLIYLDPPFNSNTSYNLLFGNGKARRGGKSAQVRAFADTWRWDETAAQRVEGLARAAAHPAHKAVVGLRTLIGEGGMLAYLSYMAERLAEMPRILKRTGSIYLHCDPTASHGLKLVMDTIFGPRSCFRFRNEIIWKRTYSHGGARRWGPIHDTLLFYTGAGRYTWNRVHQAYDPAYIAKYYRLRDNRGRYQLVSLTGAGTRDGESGQPWQGVNPTDSGRHWAVPAKALASVAGDRDVVRLSVQEKLDVLDAAGLIHWPPTGHTPRQKRYLKEAPGVQIQDIIVDVGPIARGSERLGYPTQKPLKLLERIIEASSNPGDMVLDPFCGCGTAVAAAHKLNRRWAGIDISPFAIDLIAQKRFPEFKVPTEGYPYDLAGAAKLAKDAPFKFEKWAVTRVPGLAPNDRQVGDGGIDGVGYLLAKPENGATDQVLAQVKGGKYQLGQLRDFIGVLEREKAAMGVYTTVNPIRAPGAHAEAAKRGRLRLGATDYPRAQLWSIRDYFDDRMPMLPALADPYTGKPVQGSLQMSLLTGATE